MYVLPSELVGELCSNRTFMELKLSVRVPLLCFGYGSNRTFMELKCGHRVDFEQRPYVLIVPLWN